MVRNFEVTGNLQQFDRSNGAYVIGLTDDPQRTGLVLPGEPFTFQMQ
jgi:hypothetical protein